MPNSIKFTQRSACLCFGGTSNWRSAGGGGPNEVAKPEVAPGYDTTRHLARIAGTSPDHGESWQTGLLSFRFDKVMLFYWVFFFSFYLTLNDRMLRSSALMTAAVPLSAGGELSVEATRLAFGETGGRVLLVKWTINNRHRDTIAVAYAKCSQ